jgi:hypothetical protein
VNRPRPTPHLVSRPNAAGIAPALSAVLTWARSRRDIGGLALVGSHARGTARAGSDVDLVLLTDEPALYVRDDAWAAELGGQIVRTKRWGELTERRVRLPSGLELDIGIARRSWARTDPIDDGTLDVVRGGISVLHDPEGLLAGLLGRRLRG